MQQKEKNQMSYFRLIKNSILEYFKDIYEGSIHVGQKVYDNLENALECVLTVESFWRTDYSNGFHNPDLYESSVLTSMEEMKRALFEANKGKKTLSLLQESFNDTRRLHVIFTTLEFRIYLCRKP